VHILGCGEKTSAVPVVCCCGAVSGIGVCG